ncbi:MAG: DUF1214 domain-containing protein [Myxococcales bacterium]|nr:DUF1214 domain-containing protein [Myxococcales bacterium]
MFVERTPEESEQRVEAGTTWEEFCDQLKLAGSIITRDSSPSGALDRSEGFRYLSRMLRAALETFVENSDPMAPSLGRVVHETAKMGADNPDNRYYNAPLRGDQEYLIRGNRGSVHYLAFATQVGHYGRGGGMPPTGFIEAKDLQLDPDGGFELVISKQRHAGNWLPMSDETGTLIIRQTFLDREHEVPAELHLELLNQPPAPGQLTPQRIDQGLGQSSALVLGAAALFASWAEGFQAHTNQLPEFSAETSRAFGGDPNITYYHSYWRLDPDQALVIETPVPACDAWNFQLNNHWMESLDYRYFTIHVNKHTARYRADGSVRIVVAHRDPGVPNWIDTCGHDRGTMCFRWVRAEATPQPRTRVVILAELASEIEQPG